MRILWIPHTGWHIPQRAHQFCRTLAEHHDVHVTDWIADFYTIKDYLSLRYLRNFTYRHYMDDKVTVHGIPRISPTVFFPALRRINTAIFNRQVERIITKHNIDVVVGTYLIPPPAAAKRVIYDLFDDNVAFWRSFGTDQSYTDEIAAVEAQYFKSADAVVAVSSVLMDKARAEGATAPLFHIPNGVDVSQFDHADTTGIRQKYNVSGKLVGSVGNHDKVEEVDRILDIAAAYKDQDVTFLIAGRGAAVPHARERANREGLTNMRFEGYITPEQAVHIISALDVGLCPYTKSLGDDARSPMRLLMYAAGGVPTVCTNIEEVERMAFPNVVVVQDDAAEFIDGVRQALTMDKVRPAEIMDYDTPTLVKRFEAILAGEPVAVME